MNGVRMGRVLVCLLAALSLYADCGRPWAADSRPLRILALGDSLVAGYGLDRRSGFMAQLAVRLTTQGHRVVVIDGGVAGDTTAGGLRRLDWLLAEKPDLAIVELGANDGLRGLDPADTERNLDQILVRLRQANVKVLLTGMRAPPNFGKPYVERFNAVFPALAKKHGVAFYPFFLTGVAADPALNQADGIHPNAKGVAIIATGVASALAPLLGPPN